MNGASATALEMPRPTSGTRLIARDARGRITREASPAWRREEPELPFPDAVFDTALCRQELQLLPDRSRALSEIRRVLVPGGRIAVSVWGPIERNPAFDALADAFQRHAGIGAAAAVRWLFCLSDPGDLRALLSAAGFEAIRVAPARRSTQLPSVADFVGCAASRPPLDAAVDPLADDVRRRILDDLESRLGPWLDTDGLTVATETNTAVGRR